MNCRMVKRDISVHEEAALKMSSSAFLLKAKATDWIFLLSSLNLNTKFSMNDFPFLNLIFTLQKRARTCALACMNS